MKRIILLMTLTLALACQHNPKSNSAEIIGIERFSSKLNEEVQLIDVRTPKEYAKGHINNAKNIDFLNKELFESQINKLDKTKPVLIYCKSGGRSGKASKILSEKGFKEVYDLDGGYNTWSKAQ